MAGFLADYLPGAQVCIVTRGFTSGATSTVNQIIRSGTKLTPLEIMDSLMSDDFHFFDYNR